VKKALGLLAPFIGFELLVQAISLGAGLMIVRTLPKSEYAVFIVAFAMQSSISVLADSGLAGALMAVGGKLFHERSQLGKAIAATLELRNIFFVFSLTVLVPFSIYLLWRESLSWWLIVLVTLLVSIGGFLQLSQGVYLTVNRLFYRTTSIQIINLAAALSRAVLISVFILTATLSSLTALVASLVAFTIQFISSRHIANRQTALILTDFGEVRKQILALTQRQLPNTIYYLIQGQISLYLISLFGNVRSVADVGALGRLGALFLVLGSVSSNIIFPRMSRASLPRLKRLFIIVVTGYIGAGVVLVALAIAVPDIFLWLLGTQYLSLRSELHLVIISAVLGQISALFWGMNTARGWIMPATISVSFGLASQVCGIWIFGADTVAGVLNISIFAFSIGLVTNVVFTILNLWKAGGREADDLLRDTNT